MILLALVLAAENPNMTIFGAGYNSCAKAMMPDHYQASFIWVMGLFSGMNMEAGANVGMSTDGDGIMGEVKMICAREPSLPLWRVAQSIYVKLRTEQR